MAQVMRILDANANRAREALRVLEDAARFMLDDAELSALAKALRHELAEALSGLNDLHPWRDTPGDVGTGISTDREMQRSSAWQVTTAAGKRLSEALRALEEYGKVIDADFAGRVEALRYRGYELERRLSLAMAGGRARQWRLCVLISQDLCIGGNWLAVAHAAVAGGADCIQLREKNLEGGELLARTRTLVRLCQPNRVSVVVNDRPDVALLAGADGVHLGQGDLACKEVRRLVGRQLLVGVSTSRIEQAGQALSDGADYCGVGPMFQTKTKPKDVIAGLDYLRQFVAWGRLPHLAIGGIEPGNISQVVKAGASGVAVSGCVCASDQPEQVVRALVDAVKAGGRTAPSGDLAAGEQG